MCCWRLFLQPLVSLNQCMTGMAPDMGRMAEKVIVSLFQKNEMFCCCIPRDSIV